MVNGLSQEALQHIVERPKHLDLGGKCNGKYAKVAATLKIMERTKALCYDTEEFKREFGKHGKASMQIALKKLGIKKPRVAEDSGKIYVWSNDEK